MRAHRTITLDKTISLVSLSNVSQGHMRELIWTIILLFVLSCSSEKQAERSGNASVAAGVTGTTQQIASVAPEPYALEISPKAASHDSTVSLISSGFVAQDAKIEWLINGTPIESSMPNQLKLSQANKGDTLQARAFVRGREILSNTINIVNAPPEITAIKILTEAMKPGDVLGVAVEGSDLDGDKVTFLYEWTINGEPAGTEGKIGGLTKRGDSVVVKVTPYDGENYGKAIVLSREIQNLPPVIQEHGEFNFDGTRYTYQVKATDPDGDALTYALESPSDGMTIEKSSGLITWIVPAEFKGKTSVSVVVTDGHGGISKYVLNITIQ